MIGIVKDGLSLGRNVKCNFHFSASDLLVMPEAVQRKKPCSTIF